MYWNFSRILRYITKYNIKCTNRQILLGNMVVTEEGTFYCDTVGFKPVSFDQSQTQKPDNLLKVVYVELGKPP